MPFCYSFFKANLDVNSVILKKDFFSFPVCISNLDLIFWGVVHTLLVKINFSIFLKHLKSFFKCKHGSMRGLESMDIVL